MILTKRLRSIIFILVLILIIVQSFFIAFAARGGFVKDWNIIDSKSNEQCKVENKPPYKGTVIKPIALYIGTNTVVLKPQKGYEYLVVLSGVNIKNGNWQAGNKFYFLKPYTEYDFYQRDKETEHHLMSSESEKLTLKTRDFLYNGMYYNWLSQNQNNNFYNYRNENNNSEDLNDGNDKLNGVTIAGDNSYGATLKACLNSKNPIYSNDYSYQWQRNGEDIPNENKGSYKLTEDDIGKKIRVAISKDS